LRRDIVLLGDEVLRRKAKPVPAVDGPVRRLMDDLIETMHASHGLGLAAPQLGVAKRVIVAWDGECDVLALANPQIKKRSGRQTGSEGCLSMPGLYGTVSRARKVVVTGLDRAGRTVVVEAEGLLARALQHEIDHLNGDLFIDLAEDLWWTVAVQPGERIDDEEVEEEEDGTRFREIETTVDEAIAHFAAVREARDEVAAAS